MPANVVKSPEDEKHWEKAKEIAKKEGHEKNYAYIMHIFEVMKGAGKRLKKTRPGAHKLPE